MRTLKISVLLLSMVLVNAGCGFKFRGQLHNSLKGQIIVINAAEDFHPLMVDLKRQLHRLGAIVEVATTETTKATTATPSSALVVYLSKPREQRKILSVDDTGRSLEYEFSVEMDVLIKSVSSLIKDPEAVDERSSSIFDRRVLVYDNNQLLAKSREREEVRAEMYQVLVAQLIERLRAQTP